MSEAVARSFAAQISELGDMIGSDWRWPSPDAAFARWLARQVSAQLPVDLQPIDLTQVHWHEAPSLAATGYLLSAERVDSAAGDSWRVGIEKVMRRDPLPDDRNSFVYRPVELLGIAVGASALQHEPVIEWLRTTLSGAVDISSDPWARALTAWASGLVGAAAGDLDVNDQWVSAVCLLSGTGDVDVNAFLESAIVAGTDPPDVAHAATLWAALHLVVGLAARGFQSGTGDPAKLVEGICRRFPAFARQLTKRHQGRETLVIRDEYDVQDALHAALRLHFDDVRNEEPSPSRAASGSRLDLLLKRERIIIETKMMRPSLSQKKVLDEIAADKERYRAHPDCGTIIFFIYDPAGELHNPVALEHDASEIIGETKCQVIVAPREHGAESIR